MLSFLGEPAAIFNLFLRHDKINRGKGKEKCSVKSSEANQNELQQTVIREDDM
jgi:hypothetical protein